MKELKNKIHPKIVRFLIAIIFPIAVILLWQIFYNYKLLPPSQSSSPYLIVKTFFSLLKETNFINNLFLSISRLFAGVVIGSFLGVVFGVVTSTKVSINNLFSPTIQFFSGVPVIVWIPFWIMVFGIGESFKIGLVSISTFFLVYGSTYQSIISIDKGYLELSKLYQKKYLDMVRQVFLPYSYYSILGSIRLSLMIGWIVLFFVEYSISFEGKEGIGWFIANARGVGQVDEEFVGLLSLGVTAFVCDLFVFYLQKRSIVWKK